MSRARVAKMTAMDVLGTSWRRHGVDEHLSAARIRQIAAVGGPDLKHMTVVGRYVTLLQTPMTRRTAVGWLYVEADGTVPFAQDVHQWWAEQWAPVPWSEWGWLLTAAGLTRREEQQQWWESGADLDQALTLAVLRGFTIPDALVRPVPKRSKRTAS